MSATNQSLKNSTYTNPSTKLALGFVDEAIQNELDHDQFEGDPYESKLGGNPVWLDQNIPYDTINCNLCQAPQVFLMQLYAPLPPKNSDRILYIFACQNNKCTKKPEGFSVIRVHSKKKEIIKTPTPKTEPVQTSTFEKKPSQPSFMLGNIWNTTPNINNSSKSSPFAAPSNFFKQDIQKKEDETSLAENFNKLQINDSNVIESDSAQNDDSSVLAKDEGDKSSQVEDMIEAWPKDIPNYHPYYLAFDEDIDESEAPIDLSEYKKYEDLVNEQIQKQATNEEGGLNWEGEGYEKTPLPHGMDKTFEHFGDIIQYYPDQCVRYQFNGTPLLYHHQDEISSKILSSSNNKKKTHISFSNIPKCELCGSYRTFECQLMPQLLSYLTLSNQSVQTVENQLNMALKGQNFLDQFDLGMEFGTLLIFSCKNDCQLKGNKFYSKELAYPQLQW